MTDEATDLARNDGWGPLGWQASDCVTCGVEAGEPCKPECEASTENCDCPIHQSAGSADEGEPDG